jgi:hypothetical protein
MVKLNNDFDEYVRKYLDDEEDEVEWVNPYEEEIHRVFMDEGIGIKHDAGKPKVGMVLKYFSKAIEEVAKCGTFGTAKYGNGEFWDHNWQHVENGIERYSDAMLRHYLKEKSEGEDPDTELLHAAHVAWNALARLELMLEDA